MDKVLLKKYLQIAIAILGGIAIVAGLVCSVLVLLSTSSSETDENLAHNKAEADKDFVISIVGDISLADNWEVMPVYDQRGQGVAGILAPEVLEIMRGSDFMIANNEFTVSNRGSKIPGKMYTFRAAPERLKIYEDMGVDLVTLANNHVYDFGPDAFTDLIDNLNLYKMPYIGAGKNLAEAMKSYYLTLPDGRKVGFVNASRAEKWGIDTPAATETTGGVLLCYDETLFIESIREAKANSDYVVAIVHWGTELSHRLEYIQRVSAMDYIEAGADVIVGGHAHTLQGVDYNNGKPIVYNLGDFIFNNGTEDTAIFQIKFLADGSVKFYFLPGIQENVYTRLLSGTERTAKINEILTWEGSNAQILEDGELIAR